MNEIMRRRRALIGHGYRFLTYIENPGTLDVYIDTGVIPTNTFGFKVKLAVRTFPTDSTKFGTRQDSGNTRCNFGLANNKGYVGWNGVSVASNSPNLTAEVPFIIEANYKNARQAYINGTTLNMTMGTLATFTNHFYLLGFGYYGSVYGAGQLLYSAEITQGNNTIMDLRPCYKIETGEAGLLDIINNKFYGNSSTGTIVKGELLQ